MKSNYFVAFLDILGFSEVVFGSDPEVKVKKILNTVKNAVEKTGTQAQFKHIIFSDSLLIYLKMS